MPDWIASLDEVRAVSCLPSTVRTCTSIALPRGSTTSTSPLSQRAADAASARSSFKSSGRTPSTRSFDGEQRGGCVLSLLHDRRERGAQQREFHLVRNNVEAVAQHLKCDRVEGHALLHFPP